jgi:hypothetical protein
VHVPLFDAFQTAYELCPLQQDDIQLCVNAEPFEHTWKTSIVTPPTGLAIEVLLDPELPNVQFSPAFSNIKRLKLIEITLSEHVFQYFENVHELIIVDARKGDFEEESLKKYMPKLKDRDIKYYEEYYQKKYYDEE